MKVTPTQDHLLVRPIELEKTPGGIVLPDDTKGRGTSKRGEVLEVGPGLRYQDGKIYPLDFRKGDVVLYRTSPHQESPDREKKTILVRASEVLAVLEA